jgi:hypothetical protein
MYAVMVDIFFREIRSRGSFRIPRRGAVIFVAAPHANQVNLSRESANAVYRPVDLDEGGTEGGRTANLFPSS